mmetsp:Transcript_13751/g.33277  ORF Transcript_13751/g.33277 Transcript_13751/m.33277 type:complete len:257 (+) Transcript_13751:267-1037(+)
MLGAHARRHPNAGIRHLRRPDGRVGRVRGGFRAGTGSVAGVGGVQRQVRAVGRGRRRHAVHARAVPRQWRLERRRRRELDADAGYRGAAEDGVGRVLARGGPRGEAGVRPAEGREGSSRSGEEAGDDDFELENPHGHGVDGQGRKRGRAIRTWHLCREPRKGAGRLPCVHGRRGRGGNRGGVQPKVHAGGQGHPQALQRCCPIRQGRTRIRLGATATFRKGHGHRCPDGRAGGAAQALRSHRRSQAEEGPSHRGGG